MLPRSDSQTEAFSIICEFAMSMVLARPTLLLVHVLITVRTNGFGSKEENVTVRCHRWIGHWERIALVYRTRD